MRAITLQGETRWFWQPDGFGQPRHHRGQAY